MSNGYASDHNSPQINAIPAFYTETLGTSASTTITWENVTSQVTITTEKKCLIGPNNTSGTSGLCHTVPNVPITIDAQLKQLKVTNTDGSATCEISVLAVLSRIRASDFPDQTTANGFEKV